MHEAMLLIGAGCAGGLAGGWGLGGPRWPKVLTGVSIQPNLTMKAPTLGHDPWVQDTHAHTHTHPHAHAHAHRGEDTSATAGRLPPQALAAAEKNIYLCHLKG